MKKVISFAALLGCFFMSNSVSAQEKKPVSPPAKVSQTLASGSVISIDYSQPSVKGRIIGDNLEPMQGKVWRTGANNATVFETTQDIKVDGYELPAGKYALFTIASKDTWTVIFNKTWKQWGAFNYKETDDALRIMVKTQKAPAFTEMMTFSINDKGLVTLLWGDYKISFTAE